MLASQYVLTIVLVAAGLVHWALLVVFLDLPNLIDVWKIYNAPKPTERPDYYPDDIWPLWFSAHALRHTRRFTGLLLLGLLVDCVVRLLL